VKAVLVISDRDNVATALETLQPGRTVQLCEVAVTVCQEIPRGHKMAIRLIVAGEPVVKYGSPIGIATADILAGAHVHTHNVASSRGRGDLGRPVGAAEGRLAEPSDEHTIVPDLQEAVQRRLA
jgi:SAF domain-containing protein